MSLRTEITVLYEDRQILAVYKPAGVPVQTRRIGEMDVEHWALVRTADVGDKGRRGRSGGIHIINRLDQPVEGIVLLAKDRRAADALTRQLTSGNVEKEYLAVVARGPRETGQPACGGWNILTDYLRRKPGTNLSEVVDSGTSGARKAVLKWRTLDASAQYQLLQVRLETGRHHQIRVQLSHAGMPIAGDRKYGGGEQFRFPALCAAKLSFTHPETGRRVVVRTEPQGDAFCLFQRKTDV